MNNSSNRMWSTNLIKFLSMSPKIKTISYDVFEDPVFILENGLHVSMDTIQDYYYCISDSSVIKYDSDNRMLLHNWLRLPLEDLKEMISMDGLIIRRDRWPN